MVLLLITPKYRTPDYKFEQFYLFIKTLKSLTTSIFVCQIQYLRARRR
ncbi:hypothetical protein AVDCRST_MAG92-1105 [uncultured Coleofasciculus sp.]|uniref:Uncharacterized protein n=1 Tax=uncultured Coleofasciculus sp. TaxID=1267456 RepID=A0A6J4HUW6_9CYAN|nr:hypothetical protein AVDCRST_MAG92-1105 [uncultured Coleofasciculus sp.]